MKKSILSAALAATLLAAGCMKSVSTPPLAGELTDKVVFSAAGEGISTSVETKATAVTALSTFNVGCVTGTMGSSETEVWKAAFTSDGANPPTYAGGKYWPVSDPSYKFYASNVNLSSHAAGGYTVAATNATDVVCAVLASPTYKSKNTLTFEHIFARLGQVEVSAASGYTISGISISITPKTGGTYDLFAGAGHTDGTGWSGTTSGSATSIANATPGTKSNDIYLVPGSYELTASWTATRGESVQTYTGKKQSVSLAAGKVTKITATLTGDASEILFGVSVTPWGNVTANVEFPLEEVYSFAGLQISAGPLKYTGGQYVISDDWTENSYNSVYGKTEGSTYFSFIEMGQLFEKAGFTTSDGDIDNLLNPLDGWRLPTESEWEAILGLTGREGSTVNGVSGRRLSIAYSFNSPVPNCISQVNFVIFPDGKTINGAEFNCYDEAADIANENFDSFPGTELTVDQINNYAAQGCVILPCIGEYLSSWQDGGPGYYGQYLLSNSYSFANSYCIWIGGDGGFSDNNSKSYHYPVRLVKSI